jgi:hypothetical protein
MMKLRFRSWPIAKSKSLNYFTSIWSKLMMMRSPLLKENLKLSSESLTIEF